MDAFGGDSPLSEAPSSSTKSEPSASPLQAKPEGEPEITKPKTKNKAKAKVATKSASASASASRRSSRVESRSASPEKPATATATSGIRIKFTRPPSPEKVAIPPIEEEIAAEPEAVEPKDGKRGKKRKSEGGGGVEGEVRGVMAKGKKAKISHEAEPEAEDVTVAEAEVEPKKKGVAVKRIGNGGKSSTDLMKDLFDDASEGEEGGAKEVAEPVTKPVIKIKKAPKTKQVEEEASGEIIAEKPTKSAKAAGSKPRRPRPDDSEDSGFKDEIVAEKPSQSKGSSKSSRTKQESTDNAPATNDNLPEPRTKSKKRKPDTGDPKIPVEGDMEVDQALPEEIPVDKDDADHKEPTQAKIKSKTKGNKVKTSSQEAAKEKEKESRPNSSTKNRTISEDLVQRVDTEDIEMKDPLKSTTTTAPETGLKPKRSFAQAVAGSPLPEVTQVKKDKEKKPLPSIMKLNKTNLNTGSNLGTPDKRSTSTGTGTGTNTPTTSTLRKPPPPAVKKAAPSLLESTMASLLGGHTAPKATPKKEVRPLFPVLLVSRSWDES